MFCFNIGFTFPHCALPDKIPKKVENVKLMPRFGSVSSTTTSAINLKVELYHNNNKSSKKEATTPTKKKQQRQQKSSNSNGNKE